MNLKHFFFTGFIFFFLTATAISQSDWSLRTDKEGIKVYTKNLDNSPYKAVKTVCTVDASLSRLTAVLLDIKNCADWVYATKSCKVLKQNSPSDLLYHSEVDIPWPVSNRDFVVRLVVTQDERTKAVTVLGENRPAYLPEIKNVVRIQQSYSKWLITPLQNGQLQIEYVLQVDPGGSVPAWLINMFATKGPFETFQKLRRQVKKDLYNRVSLPYIKD
ncbi:MAG: START domain-containing protein [Chitinophagaceae bacterium]|nr:START domain-containing protein [Chitinophagaceae bacterium]